MRITVEIPDGALRDVIAKEVEAAIVDVLLRHQSQNLGAIKLAVQEHLDRIATEKSRLALELFNNHMPTAPPTEKSSNLI